MRFILGLIDIVRIDGLNRVHAHDDAIRLIPTETSSQVLIERLTAFQRTDPRGRVDIVFEMATEKDVATGAIHVDHTVRALLLAAVV